MVHSFSVDKKYFIFDTESGSLFKCDELTHFVLQNDIEKLKAYSKEEIDQAIAEIDELKKEGVLYTQPQKVEIDCKPSAFKSLCLHISHNCNLACKYCFAGGGNYNGEKGNMSFEVAKASIDFLIEKSQGRRNLEVDFFGGEPLLNLDVVKQTVYYAKEQGKKFGKDFRFTLTTNTLLLNEKTTQFLNEEMDNVVLSIDGRKEIHDSVRVTPNGKGSFDLVLQKCKDFVKTRGDKSYYLRGTFSALNTDFSKDVLFLADQGFEQLSLEPVVLFEENEMQINQNHMQKICEEYEKLVIEYVKRRKNKDTWFSFFHFNVDLKNGSCLKKRIYGCGAGNNYLAVTPSGNIYPCHRFAENVEYLMGNVKDKVVDEKVREKFAKSNLLTRKKCDNCFAKYICSGGCSANNILGEGDINKPYGLSCDMMKKRVECALYVYAEEHLGD